MKPGDRVQIFDDCLEYFFKVRTRSFGVIVCAFGPNGEIWGVQFDDYQERPLSLPGYHLEVVPWSLEILESYFTNGKIPKEILSKILEENPKFRQEFIGA
jgi:hypothetical protein